MQQRQDRIGFAVLGVCILLGLTLLGYLLGHAALTYKQLDRSVTVKGLSEREYPADIVIWPIQYNVASNDLTELYQMLDGQTSQIRSYLRGNGIDVDEISVSTPAITDKSAQQYGSDVQAQYRYTAMQTVTVYSTHIDTVRNVMGSLSELGKQGIVFTGDAYQTQTEYLFTRLNAIKPEMIEEATRNAREVAQKFASDSDSTLGKIRKATQGQFSISARDKNNPHIKKIRVVSTVEYYLSD
ncbi:SIMPL domain-containing protein [Photobacterium sp. WH77]|uniref:SIMPL domain-containing protein n=1 Tax=Photobacterium arenosum TaxID=2774143 RepID=A0ABR9BLU6_9GAMM|nr:MULTISPECIES: SIMPL domain-containing protein [Photobacterium]MBD8513538.1 SIMPL domain-containing protein [Photobacterium arenosum]MBV7263496.1 SIMPL domain-containing protein [Photobacterium sp. WH24]MCG2838712.1 SIMPL domain-containing protein [Photobacterium sp. WH77]MCG2846367.1 SIMPL domain-containing protein [Photobacterium sp. WH80]MDO6583609.1 SIMPL domain-containing protein [Photobacterium sp. 2_MG-2023]